MASHFVKNLARQAAKAAGDLSRVGAKLTNLEVVESVSAVDGVPALRIVSQAARRAKVALRHETERQQHSEGRIVCNEKKASSSAVRQRCKREVWGQTVDKEEFAL